MAVTARSPLMIAVTGGSGSGKSTLARALVAALGLRVVIVEDDQYYKPRREHAPDAVTWTPAECEARINFDDTRSKDMVLFRQHLMRLKGGYAIERPIYDFSGHDRRPDGGITIAPSEIVVVEGVHVLAEPWAAELFDLTVFVDTPADLRLARRIRRDVAERGRSLERSLQQYMKFVRPAHQRLVEPVKYVCDLVLADEGVPSYQNDAPDDAATARLVSPVLAWIETQGRAG